MILTKQMKSCVLDNFPLKSLHYRFNIQYYDYFKIEKNYIDLLLYMLIIRNMIR